MNKSGRCQEEGRVKRERGRRSVRRKNEERGRMQERKEQQQTASDSSDRVWGNEGQRGA